MFVAGSFGSWILKKKHFSWDLVELQERNEFADPRVGKQKDSFVCAAFSFPVEQSPVMS